MALSEHVYTVNQLKDLLDKTESVVIYGIGMFGKCLADYLISENRRNQIRGIVVTDLSVSDTEYQGFQIQEFASFFKKCRGSLVMIAVSLAYQSEVYHTVKECDQECVFVTDRLFCEMNAGIGLREKYSLDIKIDFCVAGFQKCGTTSVFSALKELKGIYLPEEKETLFFEWYKKVEHPERVLVEKFYAEIGPGGGTKQLTGMVEPSFSRYPRQMLELLGKDIKLVFLLRNPIDALFSSFKMMVRQGAGGSEIRKIYHNRRCWEDMFTLYLKHRMEQNALTDMHYYFWLELFYRMFSKEQIKVVLFEELVQTPKVIMNEILSHIGSLETYSKDELCHANKGDFLMADEEGYCIAEARQQLTKSFMEIAKDDIEKRRQTERQLAEIERQYYAAEKKYGLKLTEKQRAMAKEYFAEDVKKLEILIGRDLTEVWDWRNQICL